MYLYTLRKVRIIGGLMKEYDLHGRKKLEYIWDYYKLHIIIILILCYFIGYIAYNFITKKEVILSVAAVNIDFSQEDALKLTEGYLTYQDMNTKKYGIDFHNSLMSQGNEADGASYEYAYASSMKLLAMMTNASLDIVIMDEKAYNTFSNNAYLHPLNDLSLNTTQKGDAVPVKFLSSDIFIGIIDNSKNMEESRKYIYYIINNL